MSKSRIIILSTVILMIISSCNLPGGQTGNEADLVATITAQALLLQAPTETQVVTETLTATETLVATETLAASNTPIPTFTPQATLPIIFTDTPTLVPSPTSGIPTVSVSLETNCRTGPGISFSSTYSLPIGQTAEVIGKNTITDYWIIKVPGNASGKTCWLWGKYATVSGDTSGLVEIATPTPVPTAKVVLQPPAAPSNLSEQNTCTNIEQDPLQEIAGTFSWTDNSNNETGFNIYVRSTGIQNSKDLLIATVGANNTSYNFNVQTLSKSPISLKVEAFNDAGKSQRKAINVAFNCP